MNIANLLIPKYGDYFSEHNYTDSQVVSVIYHPKKEIGLTLGDLPRKITTNPFPPLGKGSGSEDDYLLSIKDLSRLDQRVLLLLNEQLWSTFTFKALERKLNVHQQSLTRSLKRLLELKLIIKSTRGYKINEINEVFGDPIDNLIGETVIHEETSQTKRDRKFKQFLQVYLPIKVDVESLISALSGKWFGNLRWFGLVKKDTGYRLEWIVVDKYSNQNLFKIIVNIVADYIIVESDAEVQEEKIDAMSYSNRIVGEIIKIVKNSLNEEEEEGQSNNLHKSYANDIKYSVKKGK